MTRLLRIPPRGRSGSWLVALSIALVLAIQPIWPDRTAIGVAGLIGLTLLAATRWQLRWAPVLVLVICAISLRVAMFGNHVSDVDDVTRAAIGYSMGGGNPYGFGYFESKPMGAPFPYGPIALYWYAPFAWDPTFLEVAVSIAITLMLAVRAGNGRPVGLAIFAVASPIILAAVDGSNDTTAGFFILAALVLAGRWPMLGAAVLALAVAFKPYALAWLPPLVAFAGIPALLAFGVMSLVAWAPVYWLWGIGSYLKSLSMAQQVHLRDSYWSLGSILEAFAPGTVARALETVRYFAAGIVAIIGSWKVRSLDGVIVVGTLVFLIAQFAGYFGSFVYLAAIAPILCWRVDDWLHRALPEVARAYAAHLPPRVLRVPSIAATNALAAAPVASPMPAPLGSAFAGAPPPSSPADGGRTDLPRPIPRLRRGST